MYRRAAVLSTLGAAALIAIMVWFFYFYYEGRMGPEQPIAFSHRLHADVKGISCYVCHSGAMQSPRAGVPPLETCMLCHERIIITYPEIRKLRDHFARREPVEWIKVYDVPEFVYFNHEVHIRRQVDCGVCHGDVKAMDRLVAAHDLNMGLCVQCHRDNKVSHDCYVCHR